MHMMRDDSGPFMNPSYLFLARKIMNAGIINSHSGTRQNRYCERPYYDNKQKLSVHISNPAQ